MGNLLSNKKRNRLPYNLEMPLLDIGSDTLHLNMNDKDDILSYVESVSNKLENVGSRVQLLIENKEEHDKTINNQIYILNEQVGLIKKDLENLLENDKNLHTKFKTIQQEIDKNNRSNYSNSNYENTPHNIRDPYYNQSHNHSHNQSRLHLNLENEDSTEHQFDESPFLELTK